MLRRGCEMSLLPTTLAHESRDLSPVLGLSAWRIDLVVLLVSRVVRLLALGSCVVRLLLTVGQVVGGVGGVCVSRMCGASMRLLCVGVLCVPAECRAGPV